MIFGYIKESELTTQRPEGGKVTAVEVIQNDQGEWYIVVSVDWRPNESFVVTKFSQYDLKVYSMAATAMHHIVKDYRYHDPIIVRPKEGLLHIRYI